MSIIINIDTAVQSASVCLSDGGNAIDLRQNTMVKDHAAWLHLAIRDMLKENSYTIRQVQAIAISEGPGSYTGLRVGMSAAKGLCYALNIPLITINTLHLMAHSAKQECSGLLGPMIDARRSEVFTAIYDQDLQARIMPVNMILDEHSFSDLLNSEEVCFFGNGSDKFSRITQHPNAAFRSVETHAGHMSQLAEDKFLRREFADLAYAEPFYGKDFHSFVKQSL